MKIFFSRFIFVFCLLITASMLCVHLAAADTSGSQGTEAKNSSQQTYWKELSLTPEIDTNLVRGDQGRFRQDQLLPTGASGGVQDVSLTGKVGKTSYEYNGWDLVNYDYLSRLQIKKSEDLIADISWRRFRKYWDGSVIPWSPAVFGLPAELENLPDDHLHTDRSNVDVEIVQPLSKTKKIVYEYHLWQREGREVLLEGGEVAATDGLGVVLKDVGGIPLLNKVDGVSNTFVIRMPMVFRKIHHIEPSFSAEIYQDHQVRDVLSFQDAVPTMDYSSFLDSNRFADLKSKLTYDAWVKDNVYLYCGFENNYLINNSVRSTIQFMDPSFFVNPNTSNWKISNAMSLGSTILDFLRAKKLDLRLGTHAEHALTNAKGSGYSDGAFRSSDSRLNEGWFGEAASLTYRGIKNTTIYSGVEMEQRRLSYEEAFDAQSMDLFTAFGLQDPFPQDKYNATYLNFMPTFRVIHRINSRVKFLASYRWKGRFRDYNYYENSSPNYFSYLGDWSEYVNEVNAKLDIRVTQSWMSSLSYQMVTDNRRFERAGEIDTQDIDMHRFWSTVSGPVGDRLYLIFSSMYEYNRLDTPTFGFGGNNWGQGRKPFSFNGDVYILAGNINYRLTKNISGTAGYQIGSSLGNNKNLLNKVTAGLEYQINPSTSLAFQYGFIDFLDKRSLNGTDGGFQDYHDNGVSFTLKKALG